MTNLKISKMNKVPIKKLKLPRLETGDYDVLKNAVLIFDHTVSSVSSFYEIYQKARVGSTGSTTHPQQDLLRAMLVFSCSGLDAVIKQLIKDTLPLVIERDVVGKGAREEFKKFVDRRMRRTNNSDIEDKSSQLDTGFIATVFTSQKPLDELLGALQNFLIENSLQSRDQLLKVAAHFAITAEEVLKDFDITKKSFDVRNDIIHQMDVDLGSGKQGQKKRKVRGATDMLKYTENILGIAVYFINSVKKRIYGTS